MFFENMSPDKKSFINVIHLSIGLTLNFLAFNTQGFVEESVIDKASDAGNINKHAGYYSLSMVYAAFTLGNLVVAPVIDVLGERISLVLGVLNYIAFLVGFLFLNEVYLYVTSCMLGFGASIIACAQGVYLSRNSTQKTTSRNTATLWAIMQLNLLLGGILLLAVFQNSSKDIAQKTVNLMYSIFTGIAVSAAVVLAFLQKPVEVQDGSVGSLPLKKDYVKSLLSTFQLMFTKEMLILAFVFAYVGIEQSFWTGVYPTCISFTKKLGSNTNLLIALNMIVEGIGSIGAGVLFGLLGDRTRVFGRWAVITLGFVLDMIAFALIFINFPGDASLDDTQKEGYINPSVAIALICGALLGFADSCWNTQIYSLLCDMFSDNAAAAFAVFKFFQSGFSCGAFYYATVIQLQWHLLILSIFSTVATVCFFIVERMHKNFKKLEESISSTSTDEKQDIDRL